MKRGVIVANSDNNPNLDEQYTGDNGECAEFLDDFIAETREHIENVETDTITLETDPENNESINSIFRAFHSIKGLAGFVEQILVQKIAHQTETLLDCCRKGQLKIEREIITLILSSCDYIKKICDSLSLSQDKEFLDNVEKHLIALKSAVVSCGLVKAANGEKSIITKGDGEGHFLQNKSEKEEISDDFFTVQEENHNKPINDANKKEEILHAYPKEIAKDLKKSQVISENTYMKIPTNKIDSLIDMMGELIIIQSLIEQEASIRFSTNDYFVNNLSRISKVMKDIQNLSMSLRMVSLKSTFQKILRIGRDTIVELGKKVNIQMIGEDTEIDRSVAEKVLDPLVHLIKNSISHGIEDENKRIESGKCALGQVELKAYSKRGNIYIEVSDDGRGLDLDKIHKKALENNLIDPNATYKEEDIMDFIFLPGFSTTEVVNNISGRGVGMDVVRTEIAKLGGKVEIKSEEGKGSRFILKIPINLAIMNGTIINILGSNYIIPTLNIKEIIQLKDDSWVSIRGKNAIIKVRDEIIPVIPITQIFGSKETEETAPRLMIIIELEQKLKALPVRNIIGKHEIVVKPLGNEFRNLNFISGASILGDGKVSLILDVDTLFKAEGEG